MYFGSTVTYDKLYLKDEQQYNFTAPRTSSQFWDHYTTLAYTCLPHKEEWVLYTDVCLKSQWESFCC